MRERGSPPSGAVPSVGDGESPLAFLGGLEHEGGGPEDRRDGRPFRPLGVVALLEDHGLRVPSLARLVSHGILLVIFSGLEGRFYLKKCRLSWEISNSLTLPAPRIQSVQPVRKLLSHEAFRCGSVVFRDPPVRRFLHEGSGGEPGGAPSGSGFSLTSPAFAGSQPHAAPLLPRGGTQTRPWPGARSPRGRSRWCSSATTPTPRAATSRTGWPGTSPRSANWRRANRRPA